MTDIGFRPGFGVGTWTVLSSLSAAASPSAGMVPPGADDAARISTEDRSMVES